MPELDSVMNQLKANLADLLGERITKLTLKGTGYCNHAYYVETERGGRYIVKQRRTDTDGVEQNSLPVEGRLIELLSSLNLSIPLPHVVLITEHPPMYGYDFIDGEQLIDVWSGLSEQERIVVCHHLGRWHAELGLAMTKAMAIASGVQVDESRVLDPEIVNELSQILASNDVPDSWKALARQARTIFDATAGDAVFKFLHNDAHHENILIKNKQIVGIIDFGDAEYGELTQEFSRYIRDYPEYWEHILVAYEVASGQRINRDRLVSYSFLAGLDDRIEDYRRGGLDRTNAETGFVAYQRLFNRQVTQ